MADGLQNPKVDKEDDANDYVIDDYDHDDNIGEVREEGTTELQSTARHVDEAEGTACAVNSGDLKEFVGTCAPQQDVLVGKMCHTVQMQKQSVGALRSNSQIYAGVTFSLYRGKVDNSSQEGLESKAPISGQMQNNICTSSCGTFPNEVSPTSITESVLSDPNSDVSLTPLAIQKGGRTMSAIVIKKPSPDGYNWRKYGQKQVKSPEGSRSYYRCTHSECVSKKIECSDIGGGVIEVIYRGGHNHEPARKVSRTKETKTSSVESVVGTGITAIPLKILKNPEQLTSAKESMPEVPATSSPVTSVIESIQEVCQIPDRNLQDSSDPYGHAKDRIGEYQVVEPEPKRRLKRGDSTCQGSTLIAGRKPRFVVHAAGDVGISSDGYRWRKYGQKMVKGNPHPRNYYRCTSAGCPVRKQLEMSVDNTGGFTITYKGIHDHGMPVPKKRYGTPSGNTVDAAAPASMSNLQLVKSAGPEIQPLPTQWSVDRKGELTGEAMDLGGEKAIESARNLLSIGFEIAPC